MTSEPDTVQAAHPCHCHALRQAARRLTAHYDALMSPFGIRISQWVVLKRLRDAGPASVQALARDLGLDRTTMGRNLRPLERDGLVRVEAGTDRRVRLLRLTPEGEALLEAAAPAWRRAQAEVEDRFGTARMAALQGELHRLAVAVDAAPAEAPAVTPEGTPEGA